MKCDVLCLVNRPNLGRYIIPEPMYELWLFRTKLSRGKLHLLWATTLWVLIWNNDHLRLKLFSGRGEASTLNLCGSAETFFNIWLCMVWLMFWGDFVLSQLGYYQVPQFTPQQSSDMSGPQRTQTDWITDGFTVLCVLVVEMAVNPGGQLKFELLQLIIISQCHWL